MALSMHERVDSSPNAWCELIHRRCGLTIRSAQVPTVIQSVRMHVEATGTTERAYYEQLAAAPDADPEWVALVERLVNHETSFFRHPPSFDVLRARLLPDLRAARGRARLNLLSAGCSTGQEAYSMAMVAKDHEPTADFAIWGCDISRYAIDLARRARFGRRAIAGVPDEYRRRFLIECGETAMPEFEICEELRRRVRFSAANLFSARYPAPPHASRQVWMVSDACQVASAFCPAARDSSTRRSSSCCTAEKLSCSIRRTSCCDADKA
jgi:chemotaxis methyl-accepting protein methylase